MQAEVGDRTEPKAAGVADQRGGLKGATGASASPPVPGGRGGHRPERNRNECGGADPLEESRPAELGRTHAQEYQEDGDGADERPSDQEHPPPEPVRVPREDRGEHHFGDRLRRPDQTDVEAVGPAAGKVAETELDRHTDTDGADAEHAARDQERHDGTRARVSRVQITRCVERARNLPICHPSRVACRRRNHRNNARQPAGSYNVNRLSW